MDDIPGDIDRNRFYSLAPNFLTAEGFAPRHPLEFFRTTELSISELR
jgi:hypothetical protein